ncbi:hypothetical protein O0I10_010024 [Lichtheimia ornata]|uniref:Uncharacterized protein n=1 Tax=Lichtheimia ornata TaxID=688661 RepID=A0AAD7UWE5_9FUNG|nr:uncharacterized protein O0I10_010024 [Lichtheimia ornata]KAJ8654328.1 hypothetical protein O0I10_010024 [Lichtheimia ornata]
MNCGFFIMRMLISMTKSILCESVRAWTYLISGSFKCWSIQVHIQLPPANDCSSSTHHVDPMNVLIPESLTEWASSRRTHPTTAPPAFLDTTTSRVHSSTNTKRNSIHSSGCNRQSLLRMTKVAIHSSSFGYFPSMESGFAQGVLCFHYTPGEIESSSDSDAESSSQSSSQATTRAMTAPPLRRQRSMLSQAMAPLQ